jgi:hypothetical protein
LNCDNTFRCAHASFDEARACADRATADDSLRRAVWLVRAEQGCGWALPARYIVGRYPTRVPPPGSMVWTGAKSMRNAQNACVTHPTVADVGAGMLGVLFFAAAVWL